MEKAATLQSDMISKTEIKKLKSGIYRAFIIKVCLVFITLCLTAYFSFNFIYQQKLQNLNTNAGVHLNTVNSLIHNNLDFMESQVQQFVADTELHRYLITHNNLSKEFVLNSWQTIAERLKWFAKIELFSYSGAENLRIDYDPLLEQAIIVEDNAYEFKDFDFLQTEITNEDALYISELALNKEYNEPTYPLTPMIKIYSNIFITSDSNEGILEVTVLANKLLDPIMQSRENVENNILLIDNDGFYIKGESEEKEWGNDFQSRKKFNFAQSFPEQWQQMLNKTQGTIKGKHHSFIFKKMSFENADNNAFSDYLLVNQISNNYIFEVLNQQITQLFVFHFVLFIVFTVALWYHYNSKITKKIQQYSLKLVSVLFNSGDAIFITNKNWQLTTINQIFIQLTGYQPADILNKKIQSLLKEPPNEEELKKIEQDIIDNGLWRGRTNISMKDGNMVPCLFSIAPVKDSDQHITHYVTHIINITEQEAIEAQLKLAAIALETKAGILITGRDGLIQRVNSSFVEITGYSSDDVIGESPTILSSGKHSKAFFEEMWHDITSKGHWEGELWNKRKNGEIYPQWTTITCIKNNNDKVKNYVATFHDITIRKELEQKLKSMASTDPLTGCLNRRSLEERYNEQVSTAKRYHQTFGLIIFDIDHFKSVNDNYGHDQGDAVLIQLAKETKKTLRDADIVARWGGEEFIVLLPLNNIDETLLTAERLRKTFKAMPSTPTITCSFGVTSYQLNDNFTDIVKRADIALYKAKESGRDKVILGREKI